MLEKKWDKTIEEFNSPCVMPSYPVPLQPGVEFFKLFVESPFPLKNIKINVPHTVGFYDDKFHLYTDTHGNMKFTNIFKESEV